MNNIRYNKNIVGMISYSAVKHAISILLYYFNNILDRAIKVIEAYLVQSQYIGSTVVVDMWYLLCYRLDVLLLPRYIQSVKNTINNSKNMAANFQFFI